jgi:hypothetical protein
MNIEIPLGEHKTCKRNKPVIGIDDFETTVLQRAVFNCIYKIGKFPTAEKLIKKLKRLWDSLTFMNKFCEYLGSQGTSFLSLLPRKENFSP